MANRDDDDFRSKRSREYRDSNRSEMHEQESTRGWPGKQTQVEASLRGAPRDASEWPGKQTPAEKLGRSRSSRVDPRPAFDRWIRSAQVQATALERALGAADAHAAIVAQGSLQRSLGVARKLVAEAPTDHVIEMRAALDQIERTAEPLIAKAPRPTTEAIDAGRGGDWQRWDREIEAWRASVGAPPAQLEPTQVAEQVANASSPLPHADQIQRAFGRHDISHVRAQVGGPAGEAAGALGAQAFAFGDQIGFASSPDLHTAAHEAAHVVQQGAGVSLKANVGAAGDAYEQHADAVADTVLRGESAEALLDQMANHGASASHAPTQLQLKEVAHSPTADQDKAREQFNLHENTELTKAKYAGKSINAPAFLHLNDDEVRHGVRLFFADRPITTGNDQVSFVDGLGPFLDALFKPLEGNDTAGHVLLLRDWIAPTDLFALVDRNRAIFENDPAKPKASLDYAVGLKGPSHWAPAVATAIGSALEPRLIESLVRMTARLVAATAKKRESGEAVTEHDLVPSHPFDWPVVMALLGRGTPTVKVADGKLAVDPGKQTHYWKLKKIEWRGGWGGPWNAVRIEPADAGAESVATELLGAAGQAYRIKRVGPYFIIPQEDALKFPEAVAHFVPDGRDAVDKLAFGKNAAAVGNAEAERAGAADKNAAVPSAIALEQEWELIRKQIAGIQIVVRPYGLDVELAGAASHHVVTKLDLPTLSGHDALVRGTMYTHQTNLLTKIAAEISTVVTEIESRHAPLKPGDPQLLSLSRLVHAANLSHLAETGEAALAEAHVAQRESITNGLEAMLGQVATQIEIAYQTAGTSSARMHGSASAFGTSINERADALRGRLAKLRSDISHNQVDPVELESLYREIDALRFETGVIAEVGQLGQLFDILGKLEDSRWIVFSELITARVSETGTDNRLETLRRGSHELRGDLQTAHSKWLKTERAARAMAAMFSAGGAKDGDKQAAAVVQPLLDSIRADLEKAGSNADVAEFLRDGYSTVDNAQTRAMIVQIATMIGVALISGGTATAVVGVSGLAAGSTAAALTGLAVETVTFTTISQVLSGDPSLAGFLENGIGNLATFGAMRVLGRALEGTVVGRTIAAGTKSGIKGIAYAAAKAGELTATMLVATGVQIAQAEYMSQLEEGRTMTMHEIAATGGQGIAMMIGISIAHRVLPSSTPLGHEFQKRLTELNKRAAEVANGGDTTSAVELMRQTREYIESEAQRAHELEGKTDDELAHLGIKRKDIAGLKKEVSKQAASLDKMDAGSLAAQLGLQTIVPGRVYAGEPQAVDAVIANYKSRGYEIKTTETGYEISKKGERSIEVFGGSEPGKALHEATQTDHVGGRTDVKPPKSSQVAEETGPGSFAVTAAAVPGSAFKGKGEAPADPGSILAEGNAALSDIASSHKEVAGNVERAHVGADSKPAQRFIEENTHVIHLKDGTFITVRVSVAALEGQTVARSVMNPTKQGMTKVDRGDNANEVRTVTLDIEGRYVIQLSNKMDASNIRRAVAHEVAEILARRVLTLQNKLPGEDVLKVGSDTTSALSPHDHGRIGEINELAREIDKGGAPAEHAQHELMALADEMGVRAGTKDADARIARISGELTPSAREALDKARIHEAELPEANAKRLEWTREEAKSDRQAQAAFDEAHRPLHQRPSANLEHKGKATKEERIALRDGARLERQQASQRTVDNLRTESAGGKHPKRRIQIGGNAALAARDPSVLLVDANERWVIDASTHIAQTAHQLEGLKAAGIGDPYEFADANERVPIEAIQYWQDKIAAQGPVVDGRATLQVDAEGKLIATIHPGDGSAAIVVEVDGIPLVASGFTKENAPGSPRDPIVGTLSPRKALVAIDKALSGLTHDPQLGAEATAVRTKLAELGGVNEGDAAKALDAMSPALRARLSEGKPLEMGTLDAQKKWADLRAADPNHVFLGDQANTITTEQAKAMHRVVVGGTGGTGVSAAEVILSKNLEAHVVMIGFEAPPGLLENGQFRSIVANYGSTELCARFHIKPVGGEHRAAPRFEFRDGYKLAAPKKDGGTYDANATPISSRNPGGRESPEDVSAATFQGDTYVAALGRFDDLPPPIAELANAAERAGGSVRKKALIDDDGLYAGYRIIIDRPNHKKIKLDVTGAASRYADKTRTDDASTKHMEAANDHDAPPESELFPGGYAPSATQAGRYRAGRFHEVDANIDDRQSP